MTFPKWYENACTVKRQLMAMRFHKTALRTFTTIIHFRLFVDSHLLVS